MRILESILTLLRLNTVNCKNSCLPGSSMCTNKNTLSFCSTNSTWISIKCPEGSSCMMANGKLSCSNGKNNKEQMIDMFSESEPEAMFKVKKDKNKNKKEKDADTNDNSNDNINDIINSNADEPKSDKNKKKKEQNKVSTKTVFRKKKTVYRTKYKKNPKTKAANDSSSSSEEENKKKSNKKDKKTKDKKNKKKTASVEPTSFTMQPQISTASTSSSNSSSNDDLLKTLSDMINKAKEKTVTKTITEKTAPREIKLEYTGPMQISSSAPASSSSKGSSGGSGSGSAGGSSSSGLGSSSGSGSSGSSGSGGASSGGSGSSGSGGASSGGSGSSGGASSGGSSGSSGLTSTGSSGSSTGSSNASGSSSGSSGGSTDSKSSSGSKSSSDSGSSGGNIIDKETIMSVMKACNFDPKPEYVDAVVKGVNKGFKDKNMAAQFLAQIAHESGGYKYDEEIACAGNKCPGQYGSDQGAPGKQYYGRGFMQLSWPANYKTASNELYQNNSLYDNPEKVATDVQTAYDVSQWFWDTNVKGKPGVGPDHFGFTTKAINGALECKNNNNIDKSKKRYAIYKEFAKQMKLDKTADEEGCYTV